MHGWKEPAGVAAAGAVLVLVAFLLRPLDDDAGQAIVGADGLVHVAGGLAFLGGVDFLLPATLAAVLGLAWFGRWWGAMRIALVMLLTDVLTRLAKLAFARPRPDFALVDAGGYSFPSGHASVGAAVAVLLAWFATRHLRGRWLVEAALGVAAVYATAMALSRMVLGVHYLSDVVAGVGLGMAVSGLVLAGSVLTEREVWRRREARTREPRTARPRSPRGQEGSAGGSPPRTP